jgi:hypothetical protein
VVVVVVVVIVVVVVLVVVVVVVVVVAAAVEFEKQETTCTCRFCRANNPNYAMRAELGRRLLDGDSDVQTLFRSVFVWP